MHMQFLLSVSVLEIGYRLVLGNGIGTVGGVTGVIQDQVYQQHQSVAQGLVVLHWQNVH